MAVRAYPSDPAAAFVREILSAALARDSDCVRDQLDLATSALTLGVCLDEVLFPAMRQLGRWWQSGHLGIEDERLATEAARGWLERLTLRAPGPEDTAPILLTCGPADQHSLGLEALGVLLRTNGQRCRVLGPRVSIRALTTAVRVNDPTAVVVVSHLRSNRLSATQSLRAVAALGVEVFYAGEAFGSVRARRHVPGTHLDTSLRGACTTLLESRKGSNPG
jgi:methanogenic corrinoid protein MtbC1